MTPQELRRNILFAILSNSERTQGKDNRTIVCDALDIAQDIEDNFAEDFDIFDE